MRAVDVKVGDVLGYVKYEGATPRLCTVLQKDVAVTRRSYMHGARTKTTGILVELHETPGAAKREVGLDNARKLIPYADALAGIEYSKALVAERQAEDERNARMENALADVIGRASVKGARVDRAYGKGAVTIHLTVEGWNKLMDALDDDRALAGLIEEPR